MELPAASIIVTEEKRKPTIWNEEDESCLPLRFP